MYLYLLWTSKSKNRSSLIFIWRYKSIPHYFIKKLTETTKNFMKKMVLLRQINNKNYYITRLLQIFPKNDLLAIAKPQSVRVKKKFTIVLYRAISLIERKLK